MIRALRRRLDLKDDAGVTMIELIVYLSLSAVIAGLVVTMIVNTIVGQRNVTSVTSASTRGQAIAQGIEKALRSAEAIGVTTDATGSDVLSVLVRPGGDCQLWRVTPGGLIEVSEGAGLPVWSEVATEVAPIDGIDYFGWVGSRFRYSFALDTEGGPVNFTGAITPRGTTRAIGTSCS